MITNGRLAKISVYPPCTNRWDTRNRTGISPDAEHGSLFHGRLIDPAEVIAFALAIGTGSVGLAYRPNGIGCEGFIRFYCTRVCSTELHIQRIYPLAAVRCGSYAIWIPRL